MKMKKLLSKLTIDYPVVSVLSVIVMITLLFVIFENVSIPVYLDYYVETPPDDGVAVAYVSGDLYEEIAGENNVKYYYSLDEAVNQTKMIDIARTDNQCSITVEIENIEKGRPLTLKICYGQESLLDYLIHTYK